MKTIVSLTTQHFCMLILLYKMFDSLEASPLGGGTTINNSSDPTKDGNETLVNAFQNIRTVIETRLQSARKIPPKYYSTSSPLHLCFEPLQIIMVDEVFQSVTVTSTITLTWKDPLVYWNSSEFGDIKNIKVSSENFRTPSVLVPKTTLSSVVVLDVPDRLDISSDGQVTAFIPTFTTTLCDLDMAYFPFDEHNCTIVFIEADPYNLTTLVTTSRDISKYFGTDAAWILLGYGCNPHDSNYTPMFEYIICFVEIKRRSSFYVLNLIGPMALTSLMTLTVFWIPAEEGEKITFLVSMFMSTSVFLNYIVDLIPRSMESLPRLNLLILAIMLQIIMTTAATVIVLRRYKQSKQIPQPQQKHHGLNLCRRLCSCQKCQNQHEKSFQKSAETNRKVTKKVKAQRNNMVSPDPMNSPYHAANEKSKLCLWTVFDPSSHEIEADALRSRKDMFSDQVPYVVSGGDADFQPPEYFLPQEDEKFGQEEKERCLTHDELDKLFFVLMSLLTASVYIFIYFT